MTLKIIRGPENAPLTPLETRTVGVLGYGNQGRAHALNLRDSGIETIVGNRAGTDNARRAHDDGFDVLDIEQASEATDLLIIALPDEAQPEVYGQIIEPHARRGATIGFLHGFAIHYRMIQPRKDLGVILVAPKGPGATLRRRYVDGIGLPCLLAVHQDSAMQDAEQMALAWAGAIGSARAGIIHTTFADETETDLFGEQAVLCGGMTWLVLAAFDTLVDAGYPPELAYLECSHELKQVADLMHEGGIASMMRAISNTAEFGAHASGPRIVDEQVRQRMKELLEEIRNGRFAERFREDHEAGSGQLNQHRAAIRGHPIEPAGEQIRSLMPWLSSENESDGRA